MMDDTYQVVDTGQGLLVSTRNGVSKKYHNII